MQINWTNKNISLKQKDKHYWYLSVLSTILPHLFCFVPDKLQKCDSFTASDPAELHLLPQSLHEIRSSYRV